MPGTRKDIYGSDWRFVFASSVRGKDHIARDVPCQDCSARSFLEGSVPYAIIADGHGSSSCPRSHIGSYIACDITGQAIQQIDPERDNISKLHAISQWIVQEWRKRVHAHLDVNPFDVSNPLEEQLALSPAKLGDRPERAYGSTLIIGAVRRSTPQFGRRRWVEHGFDASHIYLIQQGDGQCLLLHEDGSTSSPVPADESCYGNVTTSLCDSDAEEHIRCVRIDAENRIVEACGVNGVIQTNTLRSPVVGIMLASDGVTDSFAELSDSEDYLWEVAREVITTQNLIQYFEKSLPEDLAWLSKKGSQDDVSVAGIVFDDGDWNSWRNALSNRDIQKQKTLVRNDIGEGRAYLEQLLTKRKALLSDQASRLEIDHTEIEIKNLVNELSNEVSKANSIDKMREVRDFMDSFASYCPYCSARICPGDVFCDQCGCEIPIYPS